MCTCTPLPACAGSSSGVKVARTAQRRATSRTTSRKSTARSAAARPSAGAAGTSNWCEENSAKKRSGSRPASASAPMSRPGSGSARRWASSEKGDAEGSSRSSWNSCSKLASTDTLSSLESCSTASRMKRRGQAAQGVPSVSVMSHRISSSALLPSSPSTLTCAAVSGSSRRSPTDPKGLWSASGPSGVSDWFAGTQLTPAVRCRPSSAAATARPRTIAPRSQVASVTRSTALTRSAGR